MSDVTDLYPKVSSFEKGSHLPLVTAIVVVATEVYAEVVYEAPADIRNPTSM
jgi:hypothetical protein